MQQSEIGLLFDHVYWMRDRMLEAADDPAVPLRDPDPATVRDLQSTLVHELDVEWSWRRRLQQADRTSFSSADLELPADDFPTIASLKSRWDMDEGEMRAWLATLDDAALAGPCGVERDGSHPLWFHLQHLYTHAMQQFSDAAVLVSLAGRSPGEIGFLEFIRQREAMRGEATTRR
jgi:uncharacterized damage-inducible protein DinB